VAFRLASAWFVALRVVMVGWWGMMESPCDTPRPGGGVLLFGWFDCCCLRVWIVVVLVFGLLLFGWLDYRFWCCFGWNGSEYPWNGNDSLSGKSSIYMDLAF